MLRGDQAVAGVSIDEGIEGNRLVVHNIGQCPGAHCGEQEAWNLVLGMVVSMVSAQALGRVSSLIGSGLYIISSESDVEWGWFQQQKNSRPA